MKVAEIFLRLKRRKTMQTKSLY